LVTLFGNTFLAKKFLNVCLIKKILKTEFEVRGLKPVGGSKKHFKLLMEIYQQIVKITDIISKLDFPKKT